ncbi:hypothetical protein JCM10450v2_002987 [Rhodotorula kratochvilovae]
MPAKLTRSISRPFADLSNLLRPRTPSPKKGTAEERDDSLETPPSLPLDLPQTDTPPFTPPLSDDFADDLDAPFPFRGSFESHQWKECTPILDDPIGEALAEQSLAFSRLPSGAFSQAQASEPASQDCSVDVDADNEVFESPEKCRRRSHSWHALNLASDSTAENSFADETMWSHAHDDADELDLHALDASSEYSSRPPSSLDDRDDPAPRRRSEDSDGTVSTPNTSVPFASPRIIETWSPPAADVKGKGRAVDVEEDEEEFPFQPTSTPPRPKGQFVELIETCPTPPSASTNSVADAARRRSLLTASGLGIAHSFDVDDADVDQLVTAPPSRSSSRAPSRLSTRAPSRASRASTSLDRAAHAAQLPLIEPNFDSYSSSAYPDAAHFDTYTRRPRLRRSVTRIFDASEADEGFVFPKPEAVVEQLLAYPAGGRGPSLAHFPPRPVLADPEDAPAPRHVRPLSSAGLGWDRAPSSSTAAEQRRSSASPLPFSALLPSSPAAAAPARPLRFQPSHSTLYSYDLAHLPAPHTPREAPYRVSWKAVLAPTVCLGGGRGSGRYGDVWGAVERRKEDDGRRERRRSAPLEGLRRSFSRVGRRGSFFGSLAAQPEQEEEEEEPPRARVDEFALPAAQLRHARAGEGGGGGLSRARSFVSIRMGLSRLGRRMSWAPSAMSAEGDEGENWSRKARRRSSLAASLFGGGKEESSVEDLEQWVSVVVR